MNYLTIINIFSETFKFDIDELLLKNIYQISLFMNGSTFSEFEFIRTNINKGFIL